MNNRQIGSYCENCVADYLKNNSYTILDRNFHYGKHAELDILAFRGSILHIVEVKARSGNKYGLPCQAVGEVKKANIIKATKYYISKNNLYNMDVSFDIAEVYFSISGSNNNTNNNTNNNKIIISNINIIENAF